MSRYFTDVNPCLGNHPAYRFSWADVNGRFWPGAWLPSYLVSTLQSGKDRNSVRNSGNLTCLAKFIVFVSAIFGSYGNCRS